MSVDANTLPHGHGQQPSLPAQNGPESVRAGDPVGNDAMACAHVDLTFLQGLGTETGSIGLVDSRDTLGGTVSSGMDETVERSTSDHSSSAPGAASLSIPPALSSARR
jgi:hypothetical protein